jgi:hypothetical protein
MLHWTFHAVGLKIQTEIALSSMDAEYIELSQSMREVIPIIWLLEEMQRRGIQVRENHARYTMKS